MLPTILKTDQGNGISHRKSFNETLCEGYHFEVTDRIMKVGSRALYYYKAENSLLVSHFLSSRVHVLNLGTGKLRWFDHHGTTVRNMTSCNQEIISASWDGSVRITEFDTLKLRAVLTEKSMGRSPYAAISPDNKSVYSFSYDSDKNPNLTSNTIRKWNISDGRLIRTLQLPGVHISDRRCGYCAVHGNRLYVVSNSGYFNIYNCKTGQMISEHYLYDQFQSMCLLPAFNLIAVGGDLGHIYLYDLSGRSVRTIRKAHLFEISQMIVHKDNPDMMISISFDGTVKIWKLPCFEVLASVEVTRERLWNVTAGGDLLITGGESEETFIYDIKNPSQPMLKGKLVFTDDSYAFIPGGSAAFFTNNLSMMKVRKEGDGLLLEGQMAEYLLNTACNLRVLKDLFCPDPDCDSLYQAGNKGFYQLTQ